MAISTTFSLTDEQLTRRAVYCTIQDTAGATAAVPDLSIDFETAKALISSNRGYTVWMIDMIYLEYTCTADAGTRLIQLEVQDSAATPDTFGKAFTNVPLIASDVAHITFAPGLPQMQAGTPPTGVGQQVTSPDIINVQAPLPNNFYVLPNQVLRVVEIEGIEADDTMQLYITGRFLRA